MMEQREIVNLLKMEVQSAKNLIEHGIEDQRDKNMKAYLGRKMGNEIKGRSQVVSRDVADTIEWILPMLVDIFVSGEDVVEFPPTGPEDVEGAKQLTEYVNHLVQTTDAGGFTMFHDWFKDALIEKSGIVKWYLDESDQTEVQEFEGLTEEELLMASQDDRVSILALEESPQEDGSSMFNARLAKEGKKQKIGTEVIVPNDFLIRAGSMDVASSLFVAHRMKKTKSELILDGMDRSIVDNLRQDQEFEFRVHERFNFDHTWEDPTLATGHESMSKVVVYDCWLKADLDEDGIAELRHIMFSGQDILINELADDIPFAHITPIRIPHKFHGLAIADIVKDLQEIKTVLFRNMLDNMYLQNMGRYAVVDGQVNLNDLVQPRLGGFVRQTAPGMVQRLDTPALDQNVFSLLSYIDQVREDRSGVSRMSQGLDENAISSNVATGAIERVMSAAEKRVMMIARLFAETGVKELYRGLYKLVQLTVRDKDYIRLRGKFVPMNPMDYVDRDDMRVVVGIGNESRTQQLLHLNMVEQTMSGLMQAGTGLVQNENLYNMATEKARLAGRLDWDKYFTPPEEIPEQEPPMEEQVAMREIEIKEREQSLKEAEYQLEVKKFEWSRLVDVAEVELEDKQGRPVGIDTGK